MYLIKNLGVLNVHPTLKKVWDDIEDIAGPGMITSAFRPEDKGVHGQFLVRGIDRRCRHKGIGQAIARYINSRWKYDPKRPWKKVCVYHEANGNRGYHLHIQVHPNTKRK